MVKVNEYFDGKVKSLTINSLDGQQTVGVMETGDYEFGTECKERMNVISGSLKVKLPGHNEWQVFPEGSKFEVPAKAKFQVKVIADAAYLCEYL
jgi:purine/pyrimidine-nucleoside phosphorylase